MKATKEQRNRWSQTWKKKCKIEGKCYVCGNFKELERRDKGKCRRCQRRNDFYKITNPQIRPNGRKLIQSIENVLCPTCREKIKEVFEFWYDRKEP